MMLAGVDLIDMSYLTVCRQVRGSWILLK